MKLTGEKHSKLYNFFNITELSTGQLAIFFLCLSTILYSELFLILICIESGVLLTWELLFGCSIVYSFLGVIFCYVIVNLVKMISNKIRTK